MSTIIIYSLFLHKIWIYALPRHILPKKCRWRGMLTSSDTLTIAAVGRLWRSFAPYNQQGTIRTGLLGLLKIKRTKSTNLLVWKIYVIVSQLSLILWQLTSLMGWTLYINTKYFSFGDARNALKHLICHNGIIIWF